MPAHDRPRTPYNLPLVGLLALLLLGGLWYAGLFGGRSTASAAGTPATTSADPWPTAPATFTPVPTQAAVVLPTATPIALPSVRALGELAVVEYTMISTQTAAGPDTNMVKRFLGRDQVTVRVVGNVRVGVDLTIIDQTVELQRDGRGVRLQLPKAKVLSVDTPRDQTIMVDHQQRWLLSEYPGLELQAIGFAYNDIYHQVADNPDMMGLAQEMARLRITDHLRGLGFTDITITVAE